MLRESLPSSAEAWHAQQNAQAHLDLLREFGALTAEEDAERFLGESEAFAFLAEVVGDDLAGHGRHTLDAKGQR